LVRWVGGGGRGASARREADGGGRVEVLVGSLGWGRSEVEARVFYFRV
jgi:hypothetical protein